MQHKFGENAYWVYELLRYVISPLFKDPQPFISSLQGESIVPKVGTGCLESVTDVQNGRIIQVKEKSAQNKSMLASKNLPQPITKAADGHHWIRVLSAELALRLNDARSTSPTLWPKTIVLHARKGTTSYLELIPLIWIMSF